MQSKVMLKLMAISLFALFLLSACENPTISSSDRALQTSQETQSAAEKSRMNTDEQQHPIKLYPRDEGPRDPSFAEFRTKLLKAAAEHDTAFLLSILDPQIINNSDGGRGVKEFKDQWNLDRPESRIWVTLTTLISMGGSFRVNEGYKEFCAPYVTSQWPSAVSQLPKGADPLDYEVITGKDVAIRSAPNPTAPVVTNLSYDVVKVHSESSHVDGSNWLKITTPLGKEGYVLDKYIRSPSDFQACFKQVGKKWLMTEFAARE